MKALAIGAMVVLVVLGTPGRVWAGDHCSGQGQDGGAVIDCHEQQTGTGNGGPGSPVGGERYLALWLPACPGATPTDPAAAAMSCALMLDCPGTDLVRLSLWERRTADANGDPVQESWSIVTTECRSPADIGDIRRSLTWQDVVSAIRRVGVPPGRITAPGYTLVNLETTFYTEPQSFTRTLAIIGYTVDVEVTPATFTWHWGDGATSTTDTPGAPYPSTEVTHTYRRHTEKGRPLTLSVDVAYAARYRVDGGAWIDIPEEITVTGPATSLPVRQASAVLVEGR
jgi:hypothetical protein